MIFFMLIRPNLRLSSYLNILKNRNREDDISFKLSTYKTENISEIRASIELGS